MTDSVEDKQNYLRETILDKGYDGNKFMSFLQEKKGEEIILENWSMEELKLAVQEFINFNYEQNMSNKEQNNENSEEIKQNEEIKQKEENKENTEKTKETEIKPKSENTTKNNSYHKIKDSIKCKKVQNTTFSSSKNPIITLSLPEKIEGGLFSKSYVTYLVETLPLNTKSRKRYSDFEWLRQTMSSVYLGSVIPPLPKKKYGDRFNENFISKRMRGLEKFLNGFAIDPLMRTSQILNDFLTVENDSDWNQKKAEYSKLKPITEMTEMLSLTGELKTLITAEKEIYFVNIKDSAESNEDLLKKLLKLYKELVLAMNNVSRIMDEISSAWNLLYQNSEKYFDDRKTTNSYKIMSKIMQDWADSEKRQADLINVDVREYFRYIKHEFVCMKDLIEKVEFNKNNYNKSEEKLNYKKEYCFKQKDFSNCEMNKNDVDKKLLKHKDYAFSKMFPKETSVVISQKYNYGLYLNRLIEEYERLKELNGNRHNSFISSYCKKCTNIITDLHISIADLILYYSN